MDLALKAEWGNTARPVLDERVATYDTSTGAFRYYPHGDNFSIVGTGNADGSSIESVAYTSGGTFETGSSVPFHDVDDDGDVDLLDALNVATCYKAESGPCLAQHDSTGNGKVGRFDWRDFRKCYSGPDIPAACTEVGEPPATGTFALHGRPVDVLSDGKVLYYVRARYYDPEHGRWLQRDPSGYTDNSNLYEAFGSNPGRFVDPDGEGVLTLIFNGDFSQSDVAFLEGFGHGAARATGNVVIGAGKAAKELSLQVVDFGVTVVDIPATLAGFPLDVDLRSQVGRASESSTAEAGLITLTTAGNIASLGTLNVVLGTVEFAQGGSSDAFAQRVGGQGLIVLATVGASRTLPPLALTASERGVGLAARVLPKTPTTQVLIVRAAIAIERNQFALETAAQANATAAAVFFEVAGASNLPSRVAVGPPSALLLDDVGLFSEDVAPDAFFVFRGERSSVTPSVAFERGFVSKGTNLDLVRHTLRSRNDTGFVATSTEFEIALGFAGENGFVYQLVARRSSIDVNRVFGAMARFPEQAEVAIPFYVSPTDIRGAFPLYRGRLTGEFIENPGFQ